MIVRFIVILTTVLFFTSCAKDDDASDANNGFYSNADTTVTDAELYGVWSIFNLEFEGLIAYVPIQYQDCGRDFFIFSENNTYTEYLLESSDCHYFENRLNWDLTNGVITLSNNFNQSDDLVIIDLTQNQLTFKSRLDVDEDGELDIVTVYAQRYEPADIDLVSSTFTRNNNEELENLISYTWQAYDGFNEFSRYEIYRSVGDNCSKENAVLINTITDPSITEFTDLNPPAEERLCYFIKIFTDEGLLGESFLNDLNTDYIRPTPVGLNQPVVVNNQIEFDWQVSNDPYFSHYELAFSNYDGGTASASQEYTVAIIDDVNTTTFIDENPPYLENPYYVLYVHNIFGNKTSFVNLDVTTYWEVEFKRNEIIDFQQIDSYVVDPDEPIVYFYGRESGEGNSYNIHRFNYNTNQTETISDLSPPYSTNNVPIKVINSGYGKEIIISQGTKLYVYNAITLEYKYNLNAGIGTNDFTYNTNGFWVLTTSDDVFTYARDNANFDLIDTKPHFSEHQGAYLYKVFGLNNNKILIGHNNEPNSYVFDLDSDGILSFNQSVPIPIKDGWENKTQYNAAEDFIINFIENRLYSTTSFSFLQSFEQPYFPSGTSLDGFKIFGSNNDPDWQITSESIHAKEAVVFDRNLQTVQKYATIGYPHIMFENYNGDIMSISSGLKKDDIGQNVNNKADLFIELVDIE